MMIAKKVTSKFVKPLIIVLAVVMYASMTLPIASAWNPPAATIPFVDSQNHWGRGSIAWAYANNITTGTSATTFNPNGRVTRGQFVTFLYRIAGVPAVPASNHFTDVGVGRFYNNAVTWAYQNNVTTGISATSFAPGRNISREQLATMLFRHVGGAAPADALSLFPDEGQVSNWAQDGMRWAAANGIIGAGGRLNPRNNATRAEAVTMLQRVVDRFNLPLADEDYQMPVLLESGYGIISGHTGFWLNYGLLIQNPNNTIAIRFPSVRITARSADGAILATREVVLSALHPNQTLAAGFQAFGIDEEPATVDFEVIPPSDWHWTNPNLLDIPEYAPLSVDNISALGRRFTGEVFNDSEYTISNLVITIIFRDESGQIVGGDSTFPMSSLSAGSSLPFEISVSEDLITDYFEIFASARLF